MNPINYKLFLISSITYSNDDAERASFVDAMNVFSSNYPNIEGLKSKKNLEGNRVFYEEVDQKADLADIGIEASLEIARALKISIHKELVIDKSEIMESNPLVSIDNLRVFVLFDPHGFVCILYEIDLVPSKSIDFSEEVIRSIFRGRNIFINLGLFEIHKKNSIQTSSVIFECLNNFNIKFKAEDIYFDADNTLPLLFMAGQIHPPTSLFQNEEGFIDLKLCSRLPSITFTSEDSSVSQNRVSFFHAGWNYTVAAGYSKETFLNILHLMLRCQSFYFTLGYLKNYYSNELRNVIRSKSSISGFHAKKAESVQLSFQYLLASFNEYKSKLFPKYSAEMDTILHRWNCYEDIENLKGYIQLDAQSKNKIFESKTGIVIALIAFLQLYSLSGVFFDAKDFYSADPSKFGLIYTFCLFIGLYFSFLTRSKLLAFVSCSFSAMLLGSLLL